MNVEERYGTFNPNDPGVANGKLFGLPHAVEDCKLVVIPVPWEVTVSYGTGTADGPEKMLEASLQVDLFDSEFPDGWKQGIGMLEIPMHLKELSEHWQQVAQSIIQAQAAGEKLAEESAMVEGINAACEEMNAWVRSQSLACLDRGQIPVVLGGDHSTPLGQIQALAEKMGPFSILQIDAHCDLRNSYEGFQYSHASIMHNALQLPEIQRLVQVGIRDYCQEEHEYVEASEERVLMFEERYRMAHRYYGRTWQEQCSEIIGHLPELVYVSIDIDGLDPSLCPHTGTPVPGGLQFEELIFLFREVLRSGRQIIGFDLVEVAPGPDGNEWDANVGARLLYRLANLSLLFHKQAEA
ncbi:agmatinase family protein [Pontibacter sp. G13]|uniref:agmatinase family protein n=1 Tax=Pontibacter sp. G13 TaxID=3074898 RepID=UPI00288B9DE0|nr:agmatinase family protein [Pontibacter sp. G13]WNJ16365.1 agmatinase family protein [Pontibacter sp. G13]